MIQNTNSSQEFQVPSLPFETVMLELKKSDHEFILTGSRYFGLELGIDHDWDFFAEDTDEVQEFLSSLGFRKKSGGYGCNPDRFTAAVYERIDSSQRSKNIHVQLIKPEKYTLKKRAQEHIKKSGLVKMISKRTTLDKNLRRATWDLVHDLLLEEQKKNEYRQYSEHNRNHLDQVSHILGQECAENGKLKKKLRRGRITIIAHAFIVAAVTQMPVEWTDIIIDWVMNIIDKIN